MYFDVLAIGHVNLVLDDSTLFSLFSDSYLQPQHLQPQLLMQFCSHGYFVGSYCSRNF